MFRTPTALVGIALAASLGLGCSSAKTSATCDKSQELNKKFESIDTSDSKNLDKVAEAVNDLMADAPDGLKRDLSIIQEQITLLLQARKDPANATSILAKIDQTALSKAATRAGQWEKDNC